jgi:hypothetical protein
MSGRIPRIWIVSELYKPSNTSTAHILSQISGFLQEEYEIHIVAGKQASAKYGISENTNESEGEIVHYINSPFVRNQLLRILFGLYFSLCAVFILLKCLKTGDKILAVTNPQSLWLVLPWFFGTNLTFVVHDVFPENLVRTGKGSQKFVGQVLAPFFNVSLKKLKNAIVLGEDMASVIRSKGIKNVVIIRNWADEGIVASTFPEGKIRIVYGGNVGPLQGLKPFLNWFVRLDPDLFELVIRGEGSSKRELIELVKDRTIKNVYFENAFLREEQSNILGNMHFGLVSLDNNMFGMGVPSKFYNIIKAGRPVLYFGPEGTEVHQCVNKLSIGLVVNERENIQDFEKKLLSFVKSNSPEFFEAAYENNFSVRLAKNDFKHYFADNGI